MAEYVVSLPIRGTQEYVVDARSAAEAKRIVAAGYGEIDPTHWDITWHGLPTTATRADKLNEGMV